jgi:hypothetical protein
MKPGKFSMKRRTILLLAAVAGVAALFIVWPRGPREPLYQGKTLTQWIAESRTHPDGDVSKKAVAALRAIGTNALPFLVSDFTRSVPVWRRYITEWGNKHPAFKLPFRNDRVHITLAGAGLMQLGTNAAPAFPALVPWLDDPMRGYNTANILRNIGDAGVPHLIASLDGADARTISNAFAIFPRHAISPGAAQDAVAVGLSHPDAAIRAVAVKAAGAVRYNSDKLVPDLLKLANDPSPRVVQEVSNQLARLAVAPPSPTQVAAAEANHILRTNAPLRPK